MTKRFPWRHLRLLLAMLLLFLLAPLATTLGYGIVVLNIVAAIVVVTAIAAVSEDRRFLILTSVLAVLSVCSTFLASLTHNKEAALATHGISTLLVGAFTVGILRYVLRAGPVTADKIFASICVYLLMGYGWSFAFALLEDLQPGSFSGLEATASRDDYADRVVQLRYFSFVTLTTVGYGDILPKTPAARTIANLEAVMGQLYIAVLVARLVGLHIVHSAEEKKNKN